MVFPSSWISQSIQSQNSMFSGMQSFAAQASYGSGLMNGAPPQMMPPVAPPPPPTMMGVFRGYGGYGGGPTSGSWGEAVAGRLANAGHMGMGLAGAGMAGLGAASSMGLVGGGVGMAAQMMDPLGMAMRFGGGAFSLAGGGMGGMAAGIGAAALPLGVAYGATQYASALGRNFSGGMQDQMALNSTLRQNFNFLGGQGAYGRGFSQSQMGQIGGMVSQESRSNLFTSHGELQGLIAGGAQNGTFNGTRDVQEFARRFREMISTLRTVQRELGGSLSEAQEFVSQSRQAGIFGSTAATRFASTIRSTSASTGFDQGQLMQLAANGANIARSFGGNGSQGAFGALRGISSVSSAMNSGAISEGMLSEATGGLTGSDAMQSFVGDMMNQTGRFSRRAMGRYSIFGLSNRNGTGLDEGALMRFQAGDLGVGELRRMAHGRVGEMGRARAINREGLLRGALMEQGGISGQLGMMRMMVGDRVMDQGDDMASLVMQRRFHMSRPQAEVLTSMMRNQGEIARGEITDRISSGRESAMRTEVREHRSVDSFMRHMEHSVSENTGMLAARDMGRNFVNRISAMYERVTNNLLGISGDGLSGSGRAAMGRMSSGAGRNSDFAQLDIASIGYSGPNRMNGMETFDRAMFDTNLTVGERMERAGFNVSGFGGGRTGTLMREMTGGRRSAFGGHFRAGSAMTEDEVEAASRSMMLAQQGVVSGRAAELLEGMEGNEAGTRRSIMRAMSAARGAGDESQFLSRLGGGRINTDRSLATMAFMGTRGMNNPITMSRMDIEMAGRGGNSFMDRVGGAWDAAMGNDGTMETVSASEYFAAGGGAASDMRREAENLRSGRGTAGSRGMSADHRLARAADLEDTAGGISGISGDVMTTTMGRGDVRSAVASLLSEDPVQQRNALERLEALATTESDPATRSALSSIAENARRAHVSGDANGMRALIEIAMPSAERDAMKREADAVGRSYRTIADAVDAGSGTGMFSLALSDAAASIAAGRGSEGMRGIRDTMTDAALMSDEEFSTEMSGLSGALSSRSTNPEDRDRIRSLMVTATSARQRAQDVMGNGRRGARQGRETALGMLTGNSLGSMEFSIGGHRVRRNVADRMLSGRGGSEEMMAQLQEQLTSVNGFSAEAASDITGTLRDVYSADGEGGRNVSEDEYRRLAEVRERYSEDFSRVEREGRERALSSASNRDPVGAETNRILGEVNSVLRERLRAPEGAPEPNMSTIN